MSMQILKKIVLLSFIGMLCVGIYPKSTIFPSNINDLNTEGPILQPQISIEEPVVLNFGMNYVPYDIDPHMVNDVFSFQLITQVCDGLFENALSTDDNHNGGIIPGLAEDFGTWDTTGTEYTVRLRPDIIFHDGTPFDAYAVQWNIYRLFNLINTGQTYYLEIFSLYSSQGFVFQDVQVIDDLTVKFILNYPYSTFPSLLAYEGLYMVSPASTPFDRIMDPYVDTLIGTGPFMEVSYSDTLLTLAANDNYYLGKPEIDEINYIAVFYEDLNELLLSGEMDVIAPMNFSNIEPYLSNPMLTVHQPVVDNLIQYIGLNNERISTPIRQALAYATNYDAINAFYVNSEYVRATSVVPPSILYYNPNIEYPTFDVMHARQILIDAGLAGDLTIENGDEDWISLSETNPILEIPYTWNNGSVFREPVGFKLQTDCQLIGIKIILDPVTFPVFLERLFEDRDSLGIFIMGWIPEFNDPSIMIQPLCFPDGYLNFCQVNDLYINEAINDCYNTLDPVLLAQKYGDLQAYMMEEAVPYIPLLHELIYSIHSARFEEIPMGQSGILHFATVKLVQEEKTLTELVTELWEMINEIPITSWRHPIYRMVFELKFMLFSFYVDHEDFKRAYSQLLYDLKPKLTGLKIDENGNIFGNGVFKNSWLKMCPTGLVEKIDIVLGELHQEF